MPGYYISENGYIFKIENGKEVKIQMKKKPRNNVPFFYYENQRYELLNLMIQYFIGPIRVTDRLRYSINSANEIPLNSIRIKPFIKKMDISEEDERLLYRYKCEEKSWSANSRAKDIITPYEIYVSLKAHGFRCFYCEKLFNADKWQLDHYYPLSIQGKNTFENIVPACARCNRMKSNINPLQFIRTCIRIAETKRHLIFTTNG